MSFSLIIASELQNFIDISNIRESGFFDFDKCEKCLSQTAEELLDHDTYLCEKALEDDLDNVEEFCSALRYRMEERYDIRNGMYIVLDHMHNRIKANKVLRSMDVQNRQLNDYINFAHTFSSNLFLYPTDEPVQSLTLLKEGKIICRLKLPQKYLKFTQGSEFYLMKTLNLFQQKCISLAQMISRLEETSIIPEATNIFKTNYPTLIIPVERYLRQEMNRIKRLIVRSCYSIDRKINLIFEHFLRNNALFLT